jgi:ribosomal protein L37AE/L43A
MLFIEATTDCPDCGSDAVRRVRRQSLERVCLEKVFECGDCEARFARANYGMPKALLAILVRLKLLR